jgi:hypothetical protein
MASILNVDQINNAAGTSAINIDSSGNALMAGHILQIVNTTHATNVAISGATPTEYTGITTSITPKATGSHIYCIVNVTCGNQYAGGIWYSSRLYRDTTSNLIGNVNDFYMNAQYEYIGPRFLHNIIDTSGTTAGVSRTYKNYLSAETSASGNLSVNWASGDSESSMTLMEIAQ